MARVCISKRNFWLLVIGLFDAYLLLWNGDILINYALAGALLYFVRDVPARRLLITAVVMLVLLSMFYGVTNLALSSTNRPPWRLNKQTILPHSMKMYWQQRRNGRRSLMISHYLQTSRSQELAARQGSYLSALAWNTKKTNEMLTFVLPLYLFWDALVMMLLGMALYKYGVLAGNPFTGFLSETHVERLHGWSAC